MLEVVCGSTVFVVEETVTNLLGTDVNNEEATNAAKERAQQERVKESLKWLMLCAN
ncbi:MAG: hypothetical protein RMM17_14240 [Acidobacteriota bacterium]|nr:hypothetical protein [Acidobacteriota bacterium]